MSVTPEAAALFPDATITGTDLSPVQPTEVPHNVHFLVEDATEAEWLWDDNYFDYIRLNNMTGSLPSVTHVMQKAWRALKPGGWLEWHEIDPTNRCDDDSMPPFDPNAEGFCQYALHDWLDLSERAAEQSDRIFSIANQLADGMKEVGYVDVDDQATKVPLNPWPKDPRMKSWGSWYESNWLDALSAWSYKPLLALGWSKPEIEVFLVSVRKCISDRHYHVYHHFHRVTARKPLPGE